MNVSDHMCYQVRTYCTYIWLKLFFDRLVREEQSKTKQLNQLSLSIFLAFFRSKTRCGNENFAAIKWLGFVIRRDDTGKVACGLENDQVNDHRELVKK